MARSKDEEMVSLAVIMGRKLVEGVMGWESMGNNYVRYYLSRMDEEEYFYYKYFINSKMYEPDPGKDKEHDK